ncbi:MAG: bifunctional oligoribonuclease/PAP phosphatase NrnA [Phycisphaerae bacterium]|nr:bifunctional oligoribonuclease/PAP phosphatase NrnA [Phycisphaerae bacterium]NIX27923.1 bifunctional oligoribonuclease/PAP phosphatase NrnA [Phycisphaerae bacterium]
MTEKNTQNPSSSQAQTKITTVLETHRGENHVVILHDFPDPDAIASAFTHQLISADFDIHVDIVYRGEISHQQNIALVKLLAIELVNYEKSPELSQYDGAVFVDNQGSSSGAIVEALEAANVPPLIIIDHHEKQERLKPAFSDIRRVGATATIYAEYLAQGVIQLDKSRKEHVAATTALTHGLMTDTHNFIRATAEDFQAACFLSQYRDADLLEYIMSQARSKQTMEIIHQALENRLTVENVSIAGIGYLRPGDRDTIPQAADFLLSEENVHTAIVYGIVADAKQEEILIGSLRTSKLTFDPDEFIKDVFGKNEAGHYFGGGKASAGGFKIPLGFLSGSHGETYQDLKWRVYDSQIKHKIFTKIGYEQEVEES